MFANFIIRRLHIGCSLYSTQTSALAALRKKTGYTFANCKKALELHNNDLNKAESWLKEQAQSMGWTKATKLQGRQTSQGLIGVLTNENVAAMIELNCETDFVARNDQFQAMVDLAANACIQSAVQNNLTNSLVQLSFDAEDLKSIKAADGKTLADHLALMIGTVGENASLRRALVYKADESMQLAAYAHPAGVSKNSTQLGKFGGILAVAKSQDTSPNVDEISKKLCQHIVGMQPTKVGTENDIPAENPDDEKCLIHQEYLLDDSVIVNDILKENNLKVVEFKRFECGEESVSSQSLDSVETCQ